MNTLEKEPTFESIANSAKFVKVKKTTHAPLPCEKDHEYDDSALNGLLSRFPVLDLSFMDQTYYDTKLEREMPIFACIDVSSNFVSSQTKNKFNKKVPDFIVPNIEPSNYYFKIYFATSAALALSIPLVAIYALKSPMLSIIGFVLPIFGIRIGQNKDWEVFKRLRQNTKTKNYKYEFEGQIPNDVREIYHNEKKNFDSIHLICDAKNRWVAEERPLPPPNPDPLLVGVKKLKSGKDLVFLLAKFDLTPAEQYIVDEFAV